MRVMSQLIASASDPVTCERTQYEAVRLFVEGGGGGGGGACLPNVCVRAFVALGSALEHCAKRDNVPSSQWSGGMCDSGKVHINTRICSLNAHRTNVLQFRLRHYVAVAKSAKENEKYLLILHEKYGSCAYLLERRYMISSTRNE